MILEVSRCIALFSSKDEREISSFNWHLWIKVSPRFSWGVYRGGVTY